MHVVTCTLFNYVYLLLNKESNTGLSKIYSNNFFLLQACFAGAGSLRCFAAEALTLLIRSSLESYSEEVYMYALFGHVHKPHAHFGSKLSRFPIPIPESPVDVAPPP